MNKKMNLLEKYNIKAKTLLEIITSKESTKEMVSNATVGRRFILEFINDLKSNKNNNDLIWNNAQKEQPKEGGRYWCVVRETNDLGVSYYQWNCAYNPKATWRGKWSSNAISKDVVFWIELPKMPI